MHLHTILISALLTAPVASTPAPQDSPWPTVAIVRPRMVGDEDPALVDRLAAQLADGLVSERTRQLPADEVARVVGAACDDPACLQRLRTELGADFVLRSTISRQDRDYTLRLELIDNRNGAVIARVDEGCELCGLTELGSLAADLVARMRVSLAASAVVPPRLQIFSDPPGAVVTIDGRLAGVTPFDHEVLAGPHAVRITHDRHSPIERAVTLAPGAPIRLRVELRRSPETMRLRRGAWGLLVAGLASAAGGATLMALDGRCATRERDAAGDCSRLFNTDWGGAGLLAAGAGLATAGTVLLIRTRVRGGRAGLRLRAAPGSAGLAIVGAF